MQLKRVCVCILEYLKSIYSKTVKIKKWRIIYILYLKIRVLRKLELYFIRFKWIRTLRTVYQLFSCVGSVHIKFAPAK